MIISLTLILTNTWHVNKSSLVDASSSIVTFGSMVGSFKLPSVARFNAARQNFSNSRPYSFSKKSEKHKVIKTFRYNFVQKNKLFL